MARHPAPAMHEMAIHNHAAANSGAHRDIDQMTEANAGAVLPLSVGGSDPIVLNDDWQP
jgi:hypothetical protein